MALEIEMQKHVLSIGAHCWICELARPVSQCDVDLFENELDLFSQIITAQTPSYPPTAQSKTDEEGDAQLSD